MKRRTLKQQLKYAEEQFFEEYKDDFNEIIGDHFEKIAKQRFKRKMLIFAPSSVAVIAITIILCLVFLLPPTPIERKYLLENEKSTAIEISTLNEQLKTVFIDDTGSYEYKAVHFYDSEYNDTLFYQVTITSEGHLEKMNIFFYVNSAYKNQKEISENVKTTNKGGFELKYTENIIQDDIIFTYNYTATIKLKEMEIYVVYEQLSLDETSNFFTLFEQSVKKI